MEVLEEYNVVEGVAFDVDDVMDLLEGPCIMLLNDAI